jgi:ABC-type oligopeptide transport system substrate-binding subunit
MSYRYFANAGDSRNHVQAGFWGWVVGGGANAGGLLEPYLCSEFAPASKNNYNPAEFCDPAFERLWKQADRVQATSLATANNDWSAADRLLVDSAPWIPLISALRVDVVARDVHGYKRDPVIGVLYDQMWVH